MWSRAQTTAIWLTSPAISQEHFPARQQLVMASKTRSSNYGTDYDFEMLAMKDPSRSIASGTLGYYVDIDQPGADRIQRAVDASQAGDTINVAGGTYYENVQIDKSLSIKGMWQDPSTETVVDGQKKRISAHHRQE